MPFTVSEKIRIILNRRKMTISNLADKLCTSRQNLSNKFARNNLTEKEIKEIAAALNCEYDIIFTFIDTQEKI